MSRPLLVALLLVGCSRPSVGVDGSVGMDAGDAAMDLDAGAPDAPDAFVAIDAGGTDAGFAETRSALFVGNSYTMVNDLPAAVHELAAASGVFLETEVVASGGAKLCDHFSDPSAQARLSSGDHDAVVIQGQSVDMFYSGESAYFCGQNLGITARDAGARVVWFATWARKEGNEFYSRGRGATTPEEMTTLVDGFYRNMANFNGGGHVARIGRAWERTLAMAPEVELFAADGSHPSPAGTFVAACALTHSILGRVPDIPSPPPLGLDEDLAETLCDLATREPCYDALEFCGGECLSVAFDATHCGACDAACPTPRDCRLGVCDCAPAFDWPTTFTDLSALDPACHGSTPRASDDCELAAHLACDLPCGGSGVGPFLSETGDLRVVCTAADVVATTYTELATWHAGCDGITERGGDVCRDAAHRTCIARGAAAGFGPVTRGVGDAVEIACVARADVRFIPDAAIDRWGCEGYPARAWDSTCDMVVDRWCTRMGAQGGYGPLEPASGRTDGVDVVCFRR